MKVLSFVVLLSLPLYARAATPAEIDALIAAARTAPGEFSADAMIRIGSIEDAGKERRIELLEQAFERASAAGQPYKKIAAITRLPGPVGTISKEYAQEIDGLSLRLRAVEAMLPLDAKKARALFAKIPPTKLTKATCTDFLVYDLGRYYDVLEKIARDAEGAERAALLEHAAADVTSPVQIGPMARVLTSAELSDEAFGRVVAAFGKAMAKVTGDDRSFTYASKVGTQIEALTTECKRRKVSPLQLLEGYRVYLAFNLSAARCADDLTAAGGLAVLATVEAPTSSDLVAHFNQKLQMAPLQPIHELESTPSRFEGLAVGPRECKELQCLEAGEFYRDLIIGPDNKPIPQKDRGGPEWWENLGRVLKTLAAWKPTGLTPEADLFRERSAMYSGLLNLAPAGNARKTVLRAALEFIERSALQKSHPMEWFLAMNALIARTSLDPMGYREFVDEMRKSGDPLIALYANLEAAAPRPPDQVLKLL